MSSPIRLRFSILLGLVVFAVAVVAKPALLHVEPDYETGGRFRDSDVAKPSDADGNNAYGTDGWIFFNPTHLPAGDSRSGANRRPPDDNLEQSAPRYIERVEFGRLVYSARKFGYLTIDHPRAGAVSEPLQMESGALYSESGVGSSEEHELLTLTLGDNPPPRFRIGVLCDHADKPALTPMFLTWEPDDGPARRLRIKPPSLRGAWLFMEVVDFQPGAQLTLRATTRERAPATIAGLVFDRAGVEVPPRPDIALYDPRPLREALGRPRFSFQPLPGLEPERGVSRRDPSDVIQVGDTLHVWYTKIDRASDALYPSGYNGTVWHATSDDGGATWRERERAFERGKPGKADSFGAFTPNILRHDDQYYLYYTCVPVGFTNAGYKNSGRTRIAVARARSPHGPWTKPMNSIVLESTTDREKFDSYRVDDAALLARDGNIWMYYKGRQWGRTPRETKMGVAVADSPLGPFRRLNGGEPVQDSGHEVMIWPWGEGVLSLASDTGPNGRTLFFARDGLHFRPLFPGLRDLPHAPGLFRPDLTQSPEPDSVATSNGELTESRWGVSMIHGPDASLTRFQIQFGGTERD